MLHNMLRVQSVLLILLWIGCVPSTQNSLQTDAWDESVLDDLRHQLDIHGLDVMKNVIENRKSRQVKDEPEVLPNHYEIADHSKDNEPHHRVRRSDVIMKMVKSAQKTGNREELQIQSSVPFTRSSYLFGSSYILPLELEDNTPEGDTASRPQYFAVAKNKNQVGNYDSAVYIVKMNRTTGEIVLHQFLPEIAPYKMAFYIGYVTPLEKRTFFAVTGFIEEDSPFKTTVSVYMVGKGPDFGFIKMQSVPFSKVAALTFLEMHKTTYLITAMQSQQTGGTTMYSWPSQIAVLRYDQPSTYFHMYSSLPGSAVSDLVAFTTRTKAFIVAANYRDDEGNLDIFSYVYEFNEVRSSFQQTMYLSTHGARDIEHFVLAQEHYIVIANEGTGTVSNKDMNVYSNVYKVDDGKFTLVQALETYGAFMWKSLAVPNCKQDVLLIYADQRDSMDQVGMYTFSHDQESFRVAPFSIYHTDQVTATYRPLPLSLATFASQDYYTGDYSLYIVIGSNSSIDQGSSIYKLSYDVILTDSPMNAFKRFIAVELQKINDTLQDVKKLLGRAEDSLNDAVTFKGKQTITGEKTVQNLIFNNARIDRMQVTKGSILYQKSKTAMKYRANPDLVEPVSLEELERNSSMQNATAFLMYNRKEMLMLVDTQQVITVPLVFNEAYFENVQTDNMTVEGSMNGIYLTELFESVVSKEGPASIWSRKTFQQPIAFQSSVGVEGKINDLQFDQENIVMNGVDQLVTGTKTISNDITIKENLNARKLDGIDLQTEAVLLNQPAQITGIKTFTKNVRAQNVTIQNNVNGISLDTFNDVFSKSKVQSIAGEKTFKTVDSKDDVIIETLVNGYDLKSLESQSKSTSSVIYGNKVFTSNITISENLDVGKQINGLNISKDIVLKNRRETMTGKQTFLKEVTILKDIEVHGTIDGVKTTDMVTLDGDQHIHGLKMFADDLIIEGNVQMEENKTLNNIDISEFVKNIVTLDTNQDLGNFSFTDTVTMYGSSTGRINGDPVSAYHNLYNNVLHINGDQDIPGHIQISSDVLTAYTNFTSNTINGFHIPDSFAQTKDNQNFSGRVTFTNTTSFVNVSMDGFLNGVDLDAFLQDLVFKDANATITSVKNFTGDVQINRDMITSSTINNIDFSNDLLFLRKDQTVTGIKQFNVVNASDQLVNTLSDLAVSGTIDDVDLSELDLSGMTVTRNETITGAQCFQQTDYNRSVSYINNIDLSALRDDIVTINTDQTITSVKTFENLYFKGDIATTSTVNGVDVSELDQSVVYQNKPATITGDITINNNIKVLGDLHVDLIDNININNLENVLVSKSKNESIDVLLVTGEIHAESISQVQTINGLHVDGDFAYRSSNQKIEGEKVFSDIIADHVHTTGNINGVNLTILANSVVYKDTNQVISGQKTFKNEVTIEGDLTVNNLVNKINVTDWPYIRTTGIASQTVFGTKYFNSSISFGSLDVSHVNGKNVTNVLENAVRIDQAVRIEGPVVFKNGVTVDHFEYSGQDMALTGYINGIDVQELDGSILKITGEQNVKSVTIKGNFEVNKLTVNGTIDGFQIPDDLVTKHTEQEITGVKTFEHLMLNGNATVQGTVDNVNVTELAGNSLLYHKQDVQILNGNVTFTNNVAMDTVSVEGTVQGLVFNQNTFVTLHSDQNITGNIRFAQNFDARHLSVKETVNGIHLEQFNSSRVLRSSDSTITGDIIFDGNLKVGGNILTDKYVNGIDLSEYNVQSPVLDSELDTLEEKLQSTLTNQCSSLTYITMSLIDAGYRLESFTMHQEIEHRQIIHSKYFTIDGDSYLALSVTGRFYTQCADSVVMRWDTSTSKFVDHQYIPSAGGKQIEFFRTPWDDQPYLFVLNTMKGCNNVLASCQLYRWNTVKTIFELHANQNVHQATHLETFIDSQTVYIFVSSTNNTLQAWTLSSSGLLPFLQDALNDQSSTMVHSFNFNDEQYFAVGARSENTSRGFASIYKVNGGVVDFVQSLQTRGISDMTSFETKNVLYLVLANDKEVSLNGHSTYDVSVEIYAWNARSKSFAWFQSIPTHRAVNVVVHKYGTHTLLATTQFRQSVSIYRFAYELGFLKLDEIFITDVLSSNFFHLNGTSYLTVTADDNAAVKTASSVVLKVNPTGVDQDLAASIKTCAP